VYLAVHPADNLSLPVVLWTQKPKLRGIAGTISNWLPRHVSQLSFVNTAPSSAKRGAVDYDRVSGMVYWSQSAAAGDSSASKSWSIAAQPITDAVRWKSTSVVQFLESWNVGGLAVDWFTGNVYVTETEDQLIAVARYDIHHEDMYRVIISSSLARPTTVALDPYVGFVLFQHC